MQWTPLPRIAFAIATHPFNPTTRDDLPLELGDELYIIEQCADGAWFRGYLVAPPSLLAGLTSTKGATLEARVFSGIFPAACVDVKEYLSTEVPLAPEDAADHVPEEDEDEEAVAEFHDDSHHHHDGEPFSAATARNLKRSRSRRKRDSIMRANVGVSGGGGGGGGGGSGGGSNRDRPRPAAPVPMLKVGDETSSYEGEPLVDEIASCLREWHAANLHELLLNRQYPLLDEVSALVNQLDLSRRQLLNNVLTKAELERTREETVWRLVKGNKLLSREIIVRDPASGRILTGEDSSIEITTLQSVMSLLDEPPKIKVDDGQKHGHLLVEHKAFVGGTTDPTTVVLYLATKDNVQVSESFAVEFNSRGELGEMPQRLQVLFTDISQRDAEDLHLVARVYLNVAVTAGATSLPSKAMENGGTMKGSPKKVTNGGPPPVKETRLKGRVSVLFNSRPKTAGRDDAEKQALANGGGNRPPSANNVAPAVPSIPNLTPKKLNIKRAFGVGVLDVGNFMKQDQGTEQVMQIYVPKEKKNNAGHDWDKFIREIVDAHNATDKSRLTEMAERSGQVDRLHLYLRPFAADNAEELVRSMPTILHHVVPTRKIGFTGAPTKPRSDIYVTLSSAVLPRHGLLVHPRLGASPLPPSSYLSHLQLTMEIRRSTGEKIKDCIFPSSNRPALTIWRSAVIGREETWSQTVRLSLKDEDVSDAHVFLSLSGVPNPPAAMAWFPLWDQGAFLKDGDHDLILNKFDEHTALPAGNTSPESGYMSMPWFPTDEGWGGALSMGGAAAFIRVKSYLCSTRFSQDDVLLSLLQWNGLDHRSLVDILKKVVFVPEVEIVKLLREVFDALFGILVEHASKTDIEDLVLHALVTVLGIVYDRRFNMEPIVDEYAEKHFDYPFATPCLLRSFTRLLNDPAHVENSVRLRATFKVGKHIFRFIVHAREKQVLKEANIGINGSQAFVRDLRNIFKLLEQLMRSTEPRLVGSQTLAVQHFHTWLPELTGVLSREDILLIAIDFMDACSDVRGKLVLYKLVLIINYSKSDLFSQPEDRRALTVNTVRWLEPHWGKTLDATPQWREQVRLCCSVLAEQVEELGEEVSEYIPKIVDSYRSLQSSGRKERDSFSLLFPKTYPFPSKPISGRPVFDEALAELAGTLAALSNIPTSLHLVLPEDELTIFLMDALKVHMSILSCEAFPQNWLSVHIYQHKSTMRTLETLAGILVDSFLPDPDDADRFNMELWQAFFSTLLMLVGSDALALETFPEQKRRAVWKVAGDVREHGADLLRRTWEAIGWESSAEEKRKFGLEKMGGYQVQYVPGLVAPIVELCLSVHEGLRSVAVEVLQTMVVSEWTLSQDLSVIQAEMIDSLDRLFKSKRLTESITQKLFIADLIELFKPLSLNPSDPLSESVGNLLRTMDEFLDLLVAVHNTPLGEAYQIMDTLRLMEFLKDMRKEDMFIRYVHQLVNVQLSSNNLVEAALSLKLHADLYAWDVNEKVPALEDPAFPEQTAFERREQLFLEMISYYEDGKSWEHALEVYRELAEQYERTVFEYGKLARCYRAMAKLQEAILSTPRIEPRYYRVSYFGLGFPIGLRDRQFVAQASPWESLQSFADRMLMQHPSARLVETPVDSVEGQYIQIVQVHPDIDYTHPTYRKQRVPATVREHLSRKDTRSFFISHSPPDVGTHAWTEKTVFITQDPFPAILKRSEVVETMVVAVSPVERAIETVLRRTLEIQELDKRFSDSQYEKRSVDIGAFSICLTNAVDANKSVASLRDLIEEPETRPEVKEALKTALADHVAVIKKSLGTHGRLVPDGLRGVQSNCARCFEMTFRKELDEATTPAPVISPTSSAGGQWRVLQRFPDPSPTNATVNGVVVASSAVTERSESVTPTVPAVPPMTNGTTGLMAPPRPHPQELESSAASFVSTRTDDTNTRESIVEQARGRLTSMIFGPPSSSRPPLTAVNGHGHGHPPPPPPPPESRASSRSRSRSGSVSTSRSRKSRKGEEVVEGVRPITPGSGTESVVGSVRRRWSQLRLRGVERKGSGRRAGEGLGITEEER